MSEKIEHVQLLNFLADENQFKLLGTIIYNCYLHKKC